MVTWQPSSTIPGARVWGMRGIARRPMPLAPPSSGWSRILERMLLDPAARTVTHSVEGAMAPGWIGSKLVRAYRFLGPNVVELRVTTDASGQRVVNGAALVWERVR